MTIRAFRDILLEHEVNRIFVLRKRNTPCPNELAEVLGALGDLSNAVEEVHDPLNALAAMCVLVRSDQPKIDLRMQPEYVMAFLHSESEWARDENSGIPELIACLKKQLPAISLWIVSDDGTMVQMNPPPPARSPRNTKNPPEVEPPSNPGTSKTPNGYGKLRLTGGSEESPETPPQTNQEEIDSKGNDALPKEGDPKETPQRTDITPAEFDMLMGNDSQEDGEDSQETDSEEREDSNE